ncbi:MAG: type II secretion system protein GspD [Betaproteobacteria bacterium]|nr:MAG: type II secretion system protein GspD [Betaproteobacteria bacterium]
MTPGRNMDSAKDSANAYSRRSPVGRMLSFSRPVSGKRTAFPGPRHDLIISLRLYAIVLVAAALLISPCRAADDTVTLNFVNADIDAVVKAVSEMTGRNFVLDPRVKGVVNIVSARPVPRTLVYPTLLSALRLQGFTAVEGDGITKIVPEADAKQQGSIVVRPGTGLGGDRLVTTVYVLKYESAAQLVNVLRPLITPNNAIAAVPTGNALVITDYAENLRRIDKIISSLDVPAVGEPVLVQVKYASALDIVQLMNRLLADSAAVAPGAAPDAQQRVTLVADTRSNSILIRGDNSSRVARARSLIEQLDSPGRPGGNIFIIYLRNAEAVRVAQTLRALFSGGSDTTTVSAPLTTLPSLSAGNALGATAGVGTAPPVAAVSTTTTTNASAPGFTASGATIQADAANNALIVMAPEPIYNNIRSIVEKLDVRRAQIYVEALVVEVSADKAAEFGIQWNFLDPNRFNNNQTQVGGGTNFGTRGTGTNLLDAQVNLGSLGQGLNLGIIKGTITIPGIGTITNLALLARALESDANTNILSTPNLLTLDNEEAKIVVAQNVPFITGQYAQTGSSTTVTPFQTIERKDVGLILRVKPQITEGGSVRMVIYEEVSRVQDTTNVAGIITSKRSLESTVAVDDGQIIVLGGLIQDSFTDGSNRVPVIGDIPGVGALFRYDNRQRVKTNLMVFLKPTVIRTAGAGASLTSDRYDYLLGEQQKLKPAERPFWPDATAPELPTLPHPSTSTPTTVPLPRAQ